MKNKDLVITGLDWQTIYDVSTMLVQCDQVAWEAVKGLDVSEETKHELEKKINGILDFNKQLINYLKENKPSEES